MLQGLQGEIQTMPKTASVAAASAETQGSGQGSTDEPTQELTDGFHLVIDA